MVFITVCTEGMVFPALFIFQWSSFPLLLDLNLFYTAPCPVNFLRPLKDVSPHTKIAGHLLFEVLYYRFVFGNQFLFFVLPLLRGAVTDLIAFRSDGLFPGNCHCALLLFEFQDRYFSDPGFSRIRCNAWSWSRRGNWL